MLSVLKAIKIYERLHPDAYLFIWIQPNRTSVGWAQIRRPKDNAVIFDIEHLHFTTINGLRRRLFDRCYQANSPIRIPSYSIDATNRRDQLVNYVSDPSLPLLVRQLSFLYYVKREQQLISTSPNAFRPFHAAKLLANLKIISDSSNVATALSHLNLNLAFERHADLARFLAPPVIRRTQQTLSEPEEQLLTMLNAIQRQFTHIRIVYGPYTVGTLQQIGTIVDFPQSFVVIDEDGREVQPDAALTQHLLTTDESERITAWLDEQTAKFGMLMRTLIAGKRTIFNNFAAAFNDPFSRPEDRRTPKWQPTTTPSNNPTSSSQ
jgi:hypothetical protein